MKLTKIISLGMAVLLALFALSCGSTGGAAGGGKGMSWDFSDPEAGTQGWQLARSEFYMYSGSVALNRDDATFGKGLLKLDVDFSGAKDFDWSEPKLFLDFPRAMNMRGLSFFNFDFYYNPSLRTEGSFSTKIFTNNNGILVDSSKAIPAGEAVSGTPYYKSEVSVMIMPTNGFMTDMRFSIVGNFTNYKGPVFIGNMRWE